MGHKKKKEAPEFYKLQRKVGGREEQGDEAAAGSIIWQTALGLLQRLCNSHKGLNAAHHRILLSQLCCPDVTSLNFYAAEVVVQ